MELPIESGRVVILPSRKPPLGPMAGACFFSEKIACYGKLVVVVEYEVLKNHPGTQVARSFFVGDPEKAKQFLNACDRAQAVTIFSHAPRLVVGDHSFVFQKAPEGSEGERGLRACEGSRRCGTFRLNTADVACCFRTGWRRCMYEVRVVQAPGQQHPYGVAAQVTKVYDEEDEDS